MAKFNTKYFGEIFIDETKDFESVELNYNGHEIRISLHRCNEYGKKIKLCMEIIDKYSEINEMAKGAIIKKFPEDSEVKYYFESHFDMLEKEKNYEVFGVYTFEQFDIKKTVKKMNFPNLLFSIDDGKIGFSVDYMVAKEYTDEILCVKMDEELNIFEFVNES